MRPSNELNARNYNALEVKTLTAAIGHADYMLAEYGEPRTVYYVAGPDRFGRDGVFYVRPAGDVEFGGLVAAGVAIVAYKAELEGGQK